MFADWPSRRQPERRILRRWVQGKNPHVRYRFVACGKPSERTGGFQGKLKWGKQGSSYQAQYQNRDVKPGTARVTDVFKAQIEPIPKGVHHPALFPTALSQKSGSSSGVPGVTRPFQMRRLSPHAVVG